MKTNAIINLGVCVAAGFAVLTGCYETPAIDSQPDAEPQIVVDAKSSYTVASASADPVIFSISSNTPWYIENDAEGWCTVTPGASATSSLIEDITVTVDDNPKAEPRTATLTVTAEGVEEPVLVQIKQNALSKLEVSNVSGAIPQAGGDVTFTVLSDQEWKIVSNASWLTFSTNGEAGSDNAVTVTASAVETTNMRSATVRIETAEDFRTVTITQEGATVLKFSEADAAARTFAYGGGSKTFHVEASMLWSVSCDDPDVTITPFEGTTSGDITVTLPYSKYINDKTYTLTLRSDDPDIPMAEQKLTITQDSFADPVGSPDLSGFTLTADNGTAYVKSKDYWKYGTFEWTFSNVNLTSGYFDINNWGADNVVLMIRFGGSSANGTNDNLFSAKINSGSQCLIINGKKVFWSVDNGWESGWNQDFQYTTDIALGELKTFKLEIKPQTWSGFAQNNVVSRKIWINDVLVFEFSKDVCPDPERNGRWCGGDIWQSGSTHPGLQYQFGIAGGAAGSITIDSFEYTPYE